MSKITPYLWFDTQAEEAAKFYAAIFKDSKVGKIARYGNEGQEITGKKPGEVMTVEFELNGLPFVGLNGGPQFKFSEAVSFAIACADQAEVDYYWEKLTVDGGEPGPCGWVKDKFGLSWQVNPVRLGELLSGSDPAAADRVMKAMLAMKKIDIAALEAAANAG